jgi:hypothetical protein
MTTMVPTTTLMEDDIKATTEEEEEEGEDKTVRPLEDEAEQDGEFVFTSLPPGRVRNPHTVKQMYRKAPSLLSVVLFGSFPPLSSQL